ncbi:MAG: hypothetical protein EZS28_014390 [Streblomastix strix]|uniref:Uncharacterized protein n=1 Tax=Streblomastix strix TaxID=222440 RepID=A0A5J4W527_9EUKA|nr:MAG: hypothetical protein EZS28_014390 [Streblomastix strix]
MACQDFDLNSRYVNKDDSSLTYYQPFEFAYDYWCRKRGSYDIQDLKAGRDRKNNINESDYEYYKELIKTSSCWLCKAKFTILNQLTLDRIDNSLGHSKDNVRFACQYCNVARSNRDAKITRLKIQLKRYYLAKGLPMPITSEDTYHVLRNGITGGLANVIHRYNIKDETNINKMKLENTLQSANVMSTQVISYDLDNIMTHITGVDFNSLYPAVFSGLKHDFIKYTGHQIYMPVRCLDSSKFHFVYGDTDSMTLAVAGNPNKDYNHGFSEIITDQQFYDENFYKFFPDPSKGVYDVKKLLGVAYEHCGSSLIALASKNYWLLEDLDKKHPQTVKLKGPNLKSNPQINKDAYEDNIRNGTVVQGRNISLRQHQGKMSQIEVFKNGITGTHTKMIVLPNQCCCPFVWQLTADKSKSQAKILDKLLKRFDKTKKQIEIAEDSMKLSIQTILKYPRRLNLTEFVDEIQIQDSDNEIPVIIENADKIQYGGKTIQDCKSQEDIQKALQNLVQTQNVTHIRGDGEKGFASNQLMFFYNKNDIKTYFVNGSKDLTNHNRVVDSVIRTIKNAFGQDD